MANNEVTLDISTLWRVFKKHAVVVIIFTVLATVVAGVLAIAVLDKRYAATAKFYIENRQTEVATIGDINTARSMIADCIELFSTHSMRDRLAAKSGLNYTATELGGMIRMSSSNNTSFIEITITMDDPQKAVNTLNDFVTLCLAEYDRVIDSGRIEVVDPAIAFSNPVFPNTRLFLVGGFVLGFVVAYLLVFVIEILDTKVKAEDDLYHIYDIPVFAEILNFDVTAKGEYDYEYK